MRLYVREQDTREKLYTFRKVWHILLYGQILLWAAFEILAFYMIWRNRSLSSLLPAAGVLFAVCIVFMIVWHHRKKAQIGHDDTGFLRTGFYVKGSKAAGILPMILIVIVILLYLLLSFQAKGDAAYMASVTDTWQSGRLLHLHPLTGEEVIHFSKKTAAAAFPVWEAWISGITRLHPLILCHLILPVVFVPFSVLAWQELADELIPRKETAVWFASLFLTAWIVAACLEKGNGLFPVWQGDCAVVLIVMPVFLRLLLKRRDKERDNRLTDFCMTAAAFLAVLLCSWKAAAAAAIIWIGIVLIRLLEGKQYEQA